MQIARIGDGSTEQYSAEIVGGKAANLARMAALGLPVPPAFVLPIGLCAAAVKREAAAIQSMVDGLTEGIEFLENATGKLFDAGNVGYGARCRLHVHGGSRPGAHDRSPALCQRLPAPLS
jgi:hypothetical protein